MAHLELRMGECYFALCVKQGNLFRNAAQEAATHGPGRAKHLVSVRQVHKIVKALVWQLHHDQMPLDWSRLSGIELYGRLDGEICLMLFFGDFLVHIAGIYVDDKGGVLQYGTHEGALEF